MERPLPPAMSPEGEFVPAPDLVEWAEQTFILPGSPLENPDHAHLQHARIGALWTNVGNARQGRTILGTCEMGQPRATQGRWHKARAEQQIVEWFGFVPDFIWTFFAPYAVACSDVEFCALVEHEAYHAAQATDEYGFPRFNKDTGQPIWTMRGHDVEEFVGIVRRYGADAAHVRDLVDAAKRAPEIAAVSIAQACGTCLQKAA